MDLLIRTKLSTLLMSFNPYIDARESRKSGRGGRGIMSPILQLKETEKQNLTTHPRHILMSSRMSEGRGSKLNASVRICYVGHLNLLILLLLFTYVAQPVKKLHIGSTFWFALFLISTIPTI